MEGADAEQLVESPAQRTEDRMNGDSDSSGSDDGVSPSALAQARAAVAAAPTSYDAHLHLVGLLRAEDLDALRTARDAFASACPLPPPVWLEWLDDEIRVAATAAERAHVSSRVALRALGDYLSVEVALACIRFEGDRLRRSEVSEDDFERWFALHCGNVTDSAAAVCQAAGHVFPNGIAVWRTYREQLKLANASRAVQIRALAQQLSIPLRGNGAEPRDQELFGAAASLAGHSSDPADCATVGELAESHNLELAPVLDLFEGKLLAAGSKSDDHTGTRTDELVAQYAAYAASEEARSPVAACVVWERCVAECFLHAQAWLLFAEYVRRCSPSGVKRLSLLRRAVRNVPWCLPAWTALLEAAGAQGPDASLSVAREVVAGATPHVMQSDDVSSAERLSSMLVIVCQGAEMDGPRQTAISYNVAGSTSWAAVQTLAAALDRSLASRTLAMEEVIAVRGGEARWWILYAQMLESEAAARNVYQRGLAAVSSSEEAAAVGQAWLFFEGRRASPANSGLYAAAQAAVDGRVRSAPGGASGPHLVDRPHARRKRPPPPLPRPRRKKPAAGTSGPNVVSEAQSGTTATPSTAPAAVSNDGATTVRAPATVPASGTGKKPPKGRPPAEEVACEPNVVFVNNLDYTVTSDTLREVFGAAGEIADVRLPRRRDGAAKGFAYVEFSDDAAVAAALALNKMKISGREAWVRRSKPPKGKPGTARAAQPSDAGEGSGSNARSTPRPPAAMLRPRVCLNSAAVTSAQAARAAASDDVEMDQVTDAPKRQLGQDDFRAMLRRE